MNNPAHHPGHFKSSLQANPQKQTRVGSPVLNPCFLNVVVGISSNLLGLLLNFSISVVILIIFYLGMHFILLVLNVDQKL